MYHWFCGGLTLYPGCLVIAQRSRFTVNLTVLVDIVDADLCIIRTLSISSLICWRVVFPESEMRRHTAKGYGAEVHTGLQAYVG